MKNEKDKRKDKGNSRNYGSNLFGIGTRTTATTGTTEQAAHRQKSAAHMILRQINIHSRQ